MQRLSLGLLTKQCELRTPRGTLRTARGTRVTSRPISGRVRMLVRIHMAFKVSCWSGWNGYILEEPTAQKLVMHCLMKLTWSVV